MAVSETHSLFSNCSSGHFSGFYAGVEPDSFPHVDALAGSGKPGTPGHLNEFDKRRNDPELSKQLKNKIKKCNSCGKVNAFTLSNCNSCGEDLTKVEISYSSNVFTSFIYGVERVAFPLTISLRHESENLLVFDDLLVMSSCHLNVIPTSIYIPDFRYLFLNPEAGINLIQSMFDACWSVVVNQFWPDEAWRNKMLNLNGINSVDDLKQFVIAGCNYPPSQYQLHLQFMLPPLTPDHYGKFMNGLHYTPGRFFPFSFIIDALKGATGPIANANELRLDELLPQLCVNYNEYIGNAHRWYNESHNRLANFNAEDFKFVVTSNGVFDITTAQKQEGIDVKDLCKTDSKEYSNYGRPYQNKKPKGYYYSHYKTETLPVFENAKV